MKYKFQSFLSISLSSIRRTDSITDISSYSIIIPKIEIMPKPIHTDDPLCKAVSKKETGTSRNFIYFIIRLSQGIYFLKKNLIGVLEKNPRNFSSIIPFCHDFFPLLFVRDVWLDKLEHIKSTRNNSCASVLFKRKVPPRLCLILFW